MRPDNRFGRGVTAAAGVAFLFTLLLVAKSLLDFTRTGPEVQDEIVAHFSTYAALAMVRLAFWTFIISFLMAICGVAIYGMISSIRRRPMRILSALFSAGTAIAFLTTLQFSRHLLYIPGSIVASFQYRISRLYPLWEQLTPTRLTLLQGLLFVCVTAVLLWYLKTLWSRRDFSRLSVSVGLVVTAVSLFSWAVLPVEPSAIPGVGSTRQGPPNILMIGSDTLRSDRLGAWNYSRKLTPFIDALAEEGVDFTNAYVPLARTAPSLTSLLTGTFPHTHGIRDNYVSDQATRLPVKALPDILSRAGYKTAAVGDWAAADLKKISFGFEDADVSPDQWNLKYLIRQGPKDIRLFLSLFTHNRFGKSVLPELYYLAGVPMGREVGREARSRISEFANTDAPFFLMVFTSHTHIPFSSEYPYYNKFSNKNYRGESLFAMSGLNDPAEIIKKQQQGAVAFDVQQINDLYDGAVASFDAEVGRIIDHLERSGLRENTIIVIYSDHGLDLFEKHTWGQGNTLLGNDPSIRIPLIIVDPRRQRGKNEAHTVRSVDLMPTLLRLVGLSIPETVEGKSLMPYIGQTGIDMKLKAFSETGVWLASLPGIKSEHLKYPSLLDILEVPDKETGTLVISEKYIDQVIAAKDRMVRDDRWKMIYLPMEKEAVYWLYDMKSDPVGRHELSKVYPEKYHELKSDLMQWMNRDPERRLDSNGHMVKNRSG